MLYAPEDVRIYTDGSNLYVRFRCCPHRAGQHLEPFGCLAEGCACGECPPGALTREDVDPALFDEFAQMREACEAEALEHAAAARSVILAPSDMPANSLILPFPVKP